MIITAIVSVSYVKSVDDTAIVFVGIYMIIFAGILLCFECLQLCCQCGCCKVIDTFWKKNFGFLYGVIGKSVFTAFIAVLAFGVDNQAQSLAMASGCIGCIWPFIQTILFFQYPDSFDKPTKFVPQ